jgi:hypothetical protein
MYVDNDQDIKYDELRQTPISQVDVYIYMYMDMCLHMQGIW